MDENVLSVIIPVYNDVNFLSQCINSIINQTLKQIEVILVDDGSTDGSGDICDLYAKQDARIKVIHKKNEGPIKARYIGLLNSKCKYVTFADGDDFISPHSYEFAFNAIKKETDIIVFGIVRYYNMEKQIECLPKFEEGVYSRDKIIEQILPEMIWNCEEENFGIDPSLCTKIMKRDMVLTCYNEIKDMKFHYGEDMAIVYPLLLERINTMEIRKECYYFHRRKGKGNMPAYLLDEKFFSKLYILYNYLTVKSKKYKCLKNQIDGFYVYAVDLHYRVCYGERKKSLKYLFPFQKVRQGKDIILYGAGVVGNIYREQVEKIGYCNIVAWVDKESKNENIENIGRIFEIDFDYIVIAISAKTIVQDIKRKLIEKGIEEIKIVEGD